MICIKDIGIEDYKRKPEKYDEICLIKIKGKWKEYKMITDENGWLEVVFPIDNDFYTISLLRLSILLNK